MFQILLSARSRDGGTILGVVDRIPSQRLVPRPPCTTRLRLLLGLPEAEVATTMGAVAVTKMVVCCLQGNTPASISTPPYTGHGIPDDEKHNGFSNKSGAMERNKSKWCVRSIDVGVTDKTELLTTDAMKEVLKNPRT